MMGQRKHTARRCAIAVRRVVVRAEACGPAPPEERVLASSKTLANPVPHLQADNGAAHRSPRQADPHRS